MISLMRGSIFFATCLVLFIAFFLCFISFSLCICHSHNQIVCRLPEARTPFSWFCASLCHFPSVFHIIRIFHMLKKELLMCGYTFCIKRSAANQGEVEKEVQQGLTHWIHVTYIWQCGPIARTASLDTFEFITGWTIAMCICPTRQNQ